MEKTILIADDQTSVRDLLYDALTKAGYKVIATHSGTGAIELIRKQNPDLLLLDFKMSDLNGIDTLKKIRSFNNKVKIVMLTAAGTEELEKEARLSGAGGFLRKNLGIDVIIKAINDIFQIKKDYADKKILIVDDDPAVSSLISDFLAKKGFSVISASSGEEGLEKFKKEKPILILLDMKLPGMDGIMTLSRIREVDKNIGVIMITGVKDQEVFEEAKKLGAYEYIVKPFDLDYLETCVLVRISLVSA
ncbi:MAG: response regulator, partial [Candidatus Omnitrophica bacterium]|nr:response regulator [Candidatus Omnitrophota bacterium]